MSTFDDLLAEINKLPAEQDAVVAATAASHDALAAVTDVTNQEQAKIDAATSAAVLAEASAQAAADAAVAATDAAHAAFDTSLNKIIDMATSLKNPQPAVSTATP